jgi:hypothetical protein
LPAAFRAIFLIAIKMMLPSRRYIAIGTAIPPRQMKRFGIVGDSWKACTIRVFHSNARLTGSDFRIRHFFLTDFANTHVSSSKTLFSLEYCESAIISSPDENVKGDSFSGEIHSSATVIIICDIVSLSPLNW